MAGWRQIMLALVAVLVAFSGVSTFDIGGVKLADRLMNIADVGLGRSKIQNFFEAKASFNSRLPRGKRGHDIVKTLAEMVGSRFNVYNDVIKGLHEVVEKYDHSTRTNTTGIPECCKTRGLDIHRACFQRAGATTKVPISFPVEILVKMEEIHKNSPYIKWSYFGNEKGEFFLYPSDTGLDANCNDFDPRLRTWYAEASAPTPKDIVIVLDTTSEQNASLIKQAVEVLLDTTNPNDRITVIKFGNGLPRTYLGSSEHSTCFSQDLALATPQNRKAFIQFIHAADEDSHRVTSSFLPAIKKAFEYFHRAADTTKRSKLLVFFAGSDPRDVPSTDHIKTVVINENDKLEKKVVIQTYAVGKGISQNTENILRAMAESTSFNTSDIRINIGTFTRIYDGSQLRVQLHSYYNIFSDSSNVIDPIVTVPYFDFSALGGLVVSICLPVHSNGKLDGVTCVDAELEDIFFNVTYYHQGIDAYAFIIDNRGRTILHPLLHKPTHPLEEPVFIDISTLESDDELSDIIKSMKSGGSGNKTFYKRLNLFGRNPEQGLTAQVSHYFWSKVPDTDYSLCMVFTDRDGEITIGRKPELPDVNYIHPYMLHDGKTLCQHEQIPVTKDGSVVRFTGSAYRWLSDNVNSDDGNQKQRYDNFFTAGAVDQAPELKESTRWWVALTGEADEIWKEEASTKYDAMIMWRHLVTASGVIRIYPGANFTQYDPNVLSWYKLAILNHGWVQVHAIEKDSSFNLMISQAVSVGSPSAFPVAVVGGEVRHTSLYAVLENLFPVCKNASCFVMDATGSVLSHKVYTGREKRASHLLTMGPLIARYLQENDQLVKVSCLDFEMYRTVVSWKLTLQGWFISSESPRFELHVVPGTNLFMGITWERPTSNTFNCETLTECRHDSDERCKCPCFEILKFNSCNNTLPERNRNAIPVCSVLKSNFNIIQPPHQNPEIQKLPQCRTSMCEKISFKRECPEHSGCTWCSVDGTEVPGCHHQDTCDPATSPITTVIKDPNVLAAVIISIIVVVAVIAVSLYFIRRSPQLRKKCSGLIWPKMKAFEEMTTVVESSPNTTVNIRPPARPPAIYTTQGSVTSEYEIVGTIMQTPIIHPGVQVTQVNSALNTGLPSSFIPMAQSSGFSVTVPPDTDESSQIVTYSTVQISSSRATATSDPLQERDQSGSFHEGEKSPTLTNQHNEILPKSISPPDRPTRVELPQDLLMKRKTGTLDTVVQGPPTSNHTRSEQTPENVYANSEADLKFPDHSSLKLSLELDENHNSQVKEVDSIGAYSGVRYIAAQPQSVHNNIASHKSSDSALESDKANSQTILKRLE